MSSIARPRSAQFARSPTEIPGHVADTLRRYIDHPNDVRGLTAHGPLVDFLTNAQLCRDRNQGPALQTGGWRTMPVVAPHNRDIYIIGLSSHWAQAD